MDGYEIASFDGLHICLIPQDCKMICFDPTMVFKRERRTVTFRLLCCTDGLGSYLVWTGACYAFHVSEQFVQKTMNTTILFLLFLVEVFQNRKQSDNKVPVL